MHLLEYIGIRSSIVASLRNAAVRDASLQEAEESEPYYDRDSFIRDSPRCGQGAFVEDSNFPSLPLRSPAPSAGWDSSVRSTEEDKMEYKEAGGFGDGGDKKDVLLEAVLATPDHKKGNHSRRGAKSRRKVEKML